MRKIASMATVILAVAIISSVIAGDAEKNKNRLVSQYGFSIDFPLAGEATTPSYLMAQFFLPADNNFSPNVNIIRQKYDKSLEAYDKLSMNQFKQQLKAEVLTREIKGGRITYEYKGEMLSKKFHWYARAFKQNEEFYLVTATALESQWEKYKDKLVKSVNSFKLD